MNAGGKAEGGKVDETGEGWGTFFSARGGKRADQRVENGLCVWRS